MSVFDLSLELFSIIRSYMSPCCGAMLNISCREIYRKSIKKSIDILSATVNVAVLNGYFRIVEYLINNNAKYDKKTLECAALGGRSNILSFIHQRNALI